MNYINEARATTIWNGITANRLLRRCAQATAEQAAALSHVASLMQAAEPITDEEFYAARASLRAVEARLVEEYQGEVKYNRHGQPFGGTHPALI